MGVTQPVDRLFFALLPDAAAKIRLVRLTDWLREQHGLTGTAVGTKRLHVSLHHLGDYPGLPDDLVALAQRAAESIATGPFPVEFDQVTSFRRRPATFPVVLRASQGLAALETFHWMLGEALKREKLGTVLRPSFTPHVALFYDKLLVPKQAVDTVAWEAKDLVLVHSLVGRTQHKILGTWPLRGR
jgi:2'-5' RNA ligase